VVVNGKKLRRLMREHDLQPKRRRQYVVTTDSNHSGPIYPDLAKDVAPDRPNQLWVADLTYVAISGGFIYLAAILDAWSRKVVGYAISRSMDARIAAAALKAEPGSAQGLYSPFRSWVAIRFRGVSRDAYGPWPGGLDEPSRQSL
jgi:putative transposase